MDEPSEAEIWRRWWEKDFSWEGMVSKGRTVAGSESLQDYWRKDPATGHRRSDAELIEAEELIVAVGQPIFHLAHLPLHYANGEVTAKAMSPATMKAQLNEIVRRRLAAAQAAEPEVYLRSSARLSGTVLPGLSLSGADLEGLLLVNLSHAIVYGAVDCRNAVFGRNATFEQTSLLSDARFDGARFEGWATFDALVVMGVCRFDGALFKTDATFRDAYFGSDARFGGARFASSKFDGAVFAQHAEFGSAQFPYQTSFDATHFCGNAWFGKAAFGNWTNFTGARFSGRTWFDEANFLGDTRFYGVEFNTDVEFNSAVFSGRVHFGASRFLGRANFTGIRRSDAAAHWRSAFNKAAFLDFADFAGAGFEGFAAFHGARFEKGLGFDTAPSDRLAKQTFDLELRTASLADSGLERDQHLTELESGCRLIKQEMEKASDKNRAQLLFAFELRARRAQGSISPVEKFFSIAYAVSSDYGASQLRPLAWLGLLWILFAAIYALAWDTPLQPPPIPNRPGVVASAAFTALDGPVAGRAATLLSVSASRVFPFGAFDTVSKQFADALSATHHPLRVLVFRLLATFESLVAVSLIFLFGLATRRRFQIN